ncbi:hypothetical protein BaRGS_00031021 [Batillaria attramentaria]|uniref:Uncharacterized protein n=1 Tax=Batillaria attramentaria TaxID=370345 RepID=A0ABD0JT36_9CAEN
MSKNQARGKEMKSFFCRSVPRTNRSYWKNPREDPRRFYTADSVPLKWSVVRTQARMKALDSRDAQGRPRPRISFSNSCSAHPDAYKLLNMYKASGMKKAWTKGSRYEQARENFKYWPYDERSPFQMPDLEGPPLVTSITALPPHNLRRVAAMMPKVDKPKKAQKTQFMVCTRLNEPAIVM